MRIPSRDRIGQKFGKLTVVSVFVADQKYMANVICECGIKKSVRICALTSGNTKSCGCKREFDSIERDKNDTNKVMRGGVKISLRKYVAFHKRLVLKYGNPCKCEFCNTQDASRFEYALKKGREYSDNKDDYFGLCPSCHRKYDITETARKNMSKAQKGRIMKTLWIPIIQKDKNGLTIKEHPSITSAIENTKVDRANLFRALTGKRKSAGGCFWEYKI